MQPLSLYEMFWQLGAGACVATGLIVAVGVVVYLLFKPLEILDNLGRK